ncbi:MAG: DUF3500 domain-containing protein [Gemmataceae bacterium]
MSEKLTPYCSECDEAFAFPEPAPVARRDFLRAVGGATAAVALSSAALRAETPAKPARPAEELIRELHASLSDTQKARVMLPYDHGAAKNRRPTRMGMYNDAINNIRIGEVYTKAQQELVDRIVKSMCSGDEGYRQISRLGRWDASKSFDRCGALIFGDPTAGKKFSFVFSGHHLTIRCDGDSEEGAAFGGPIYYGHSPQGYSRGNVFNYQTRSVVKVYQALSGKQREEATVPRGNPGEMDDSVRFRKKAEERPGIAFAGLSKDQQALVEEVMRTVLSPYRKEDVDEVMAIIKKNGGMQKIKLAFYPDGNMDDKEPWHFWRLEGPGFVWNYRVLPHVHTYVNISSKLV